MPKGLSREAAALWPAVVKSLMDMQVLTVADGPALSRLCETYSEIIAAQREIAKPKSKGGGRFQSVKTMGGDTMVRIHPAVAALQDADRRFRQWAAEFGLTPASRTRIQVNGQPKPDQSPAQKYFA